MIAAAPPSARPSRLGLTGRAKSNLALIVAMVIALGLISTQLVVSRDNLVNGCDFTRTGNIARDGDLQHLASGFHDAIVVTHTVARIQVLTARDCKKKYPLLIWTG